MCPAQPELSALNGVIIRKALVQSRNSGRNGKAALKLMDILIFVLIAALLAYRLHSVLGQKNGEEPRRPNPLTRDANPGGPNTGSNAPLGGDNVIPMPGQDANGQRLEGSGPVLEHDDGDMPLSLDQQIARARSADPYFDEDHFLSGVKAAFPMVVEAFAKGDQDTLRSLLSDEIYQDFAQAIEAREKAGETLETRIEKLHDVSLVGVRIENRMLEVETRIISEQFNVTRNADTGAVVAGSEESAVEITDVWTFARPLGSQDPNWVLVETVAEA